MTQIRNMFPTHADRARGSIEALGAFGLDYPIEDYGRAWNTVLEVYCGALEQLLPLVRELADSSADG